MIWEIWVVCAHAFAEGERMTLGKLSFLFYLGDIRTCPDPTLFRHSDAATTTPLMTCTSAIELALLFSAPAW